MFIWYSKWIITDNLTAKSSTVSSDRASECYHNSVIRSSHQRCSIKKVFFLILQNSQENTCARVSFFNKVGIRNIWSSIHEKGKQRSDWVASLKALLIKESVYFKIETIEIDRRADQQLFRGVPRKSCSENLQQIYKKITMPKRYINKAVLQLYWNHFLAWVFSCEFIAYFQNIFS